MVDQGVGSDVPGSEPTQGEYVSASRRAQTDAEVNGAVSTTRHSHDGSQVPR